MDRHQERPVVSSYLLTILRMPYLLLVRWKVSWDLTPLMGAFLHVLHAQPSCMINELSMHFSEAFGHNDYIPSLCVNSNWPSHILYTLVSWISRSFLSLCTGRMRPFPPYFWNWYQVEDFLMDFQNNKLLNLLLHSIGTHSPPNSFAPHLIRLSYMSIVD